MPRRGREGRVERWRLSAPLNVSNAFSAFGALQAMAAKRSQNVPMPASPQEWENLLGIAAQGDQAAGTLVRKLSKSSASFPALLGLLFQSQHEVVRQLSAILLRQYISGHWGKFKPDEQKQWQARLLEHLVRDPRSAPAQSTPYPARRSPTACSRPVRTAISALIGIVARLTLPSGAWPELLPFLFQCYQSPQPELREVRHRRTSITVR